MNKWIIALFLSVAMAFAAAPAVDDLIMYMQCDTKYRQSIGLLERGRYYEAQRDFETLSRTRHFIKSDKYSAYRDSKELSDYAQAMYLVKYDNDAAGCEGALNDIPDTYTGLMFREIAHLKEEICIDDSENYDSNVEDELPRVGMNIRDVPCTDVGYWDEHTASIIDEDAKGALRIEHTYIWYTYSKNPLYEIKVRKGIVTSAERCSGNPDYWADDGSPNFGYGYAAERNREIQANCPPETQRQYRQSEVKRYIPYDPKDYSSSEDFYEDNMDEFDSLDDAEDYYDEYGGEY